MIKMETQRLIISDHKIEDLAGINELLTNEKAMYFIQDLQCKSLEESRKNLDIAIKEASSENRKKYFFAIYEKESKDYVGEVGFTILANSPLGHQAGLGYFILPRFWGKGFTTEAVKRVLDFAFEEADIFKITTGCIKNNFASEQIMIKCNMTKEADYKKHIWHDGEWKDRVEYRMLKSEWQVIKKEKMANLKF